MFRVLPYQGGTPRDISEVVNNLMNGKSNNTGTITLATGNATTTTLVDERISVYTKIILIPFSDAAEADSAPYGAFQDSTDQVAANTTTAYAMTLNTTDYSNGVYLSNSSRMNVRNYGIYNLQFSTQFVNTDSQIHDIDIWFRKNGTNIAASNSRYSVPNSHGGQGGKAQRWAACRSRLVSVQTQSLCQADLHGLESLQAIQLLDLAANKTRCLATHHRGRVLRPAIQSANRLGTQRGKKWAALAQIL